MAPRLWREAMDKAIALDNRSLGIIGLSSMLIGTVLLYLVH